MAHGSKILIDYKFKAINREQISGLEIILLKDLFENASCSKYYLQSNMFPEFLGIKIYS